MEKNMKIKSGNHEVYNSGYVHSFKQNPIEFTISVKPKMILKIQISKNDESKKPEYSITLEDNELNVNCINPHLIFNFGPENPIEIGTLLKRKLSFYFRLEIFGDYSSFAVSYTLYLGELA